MTQTIRTLRSVASSGREPPGQTTAPRELHRVERIAALAAGAAAALVPAAVFGMIGADSRWLAALGRYVWSHGAVPAGVPYASASSHGWQNVPVLAELVFHGLQQGLGDRGLLVAQLIAMAIGFWALARDALADAADPAFVGLSLFAVGVVALPELAIVRVQLFSIAFLPLLVALLRSEARRPSRRIWLLPPLLALWSNLHGAVLIGLFLALTYLALGRFRRGPLLTAAVAVASVAAVYATPALWRTPDYYYGVLHNGAAARHMGLWAQLSPRAPFDVLLVLLVAVMVLRLRLTRLQTWELGALAVLAAATAGAGRSGLWLLFFLVGPSARGTRLAPPRLRLSATLLGASLALLMVGVVRGPAGAGASQRLVAEAVSAARGTPVLAEDALAEQVALAGGRIWVGNPIDAFPRDDQDIYLDWLQGKQRGRLALAHAGRVVLVNRGSKAQELVASSGAFTAVDGDSGAVLYRRRS
jgi:hypothetical protein